MENTLNYYNSNAIDLIRRYENANVKTLHNILLESFNKEDYILELGCGSGRDAQFMYNCGYKILATDGSETLIKEAKKIHPNIDFKVVKLPEELIFENSIFDGVYSIATLMHFKKNDIEKIIYKISKILKTNGKFFFSVSVKRDDIDNFGFDKKGRFFNNLSKEEWLNICRKFNLKPIRCINNDDGLNRNGIKWLNYLVQKV